MRAVRRAGECAPVGSAIALLMPTTRPRLSSSGPPLLPASKQAGKKAQMVQESSW